jgi:hypothetical protein
MIACDCLSRYLRDSGVATRKTGGMGDHRGTDSGELYCDQGTPTEHCLGLLIDR